MLFKQMIRPYNHHNTYIILFLISFFMIFSSKFFFPPPSSYKYIWIVLFCLFRLNKNNLVHILHTQQPINPQVICLITTTCKIIMHLIILKKRVEKSWPQSA